MLNNMLRLSLAWLGTNMHDHASNVNHLATTTKLSVDEFEICIKGDTV
jgi:hypothetical protein